MRVIEMFRIAGIAGVIGFVLMGCSSSGSISDQYGVVSIEPIEAGLAPNQTPRAAQQFGCAAGAHARGKQSR